MNDRPGILIVGNYPPPYGGIPTHIHDHALWLASNGWQVHVMSAGQPSAGYEQPYENIFVHRPKPLTHQLLSTIRATFTEGTAASLRAVASGPITYFRFASAFADAVAICRAGNIKLCSAYKALAGGIVAAALKQELGIPFALTIFGEAYSHPESLRKNTRAIEYVASKADIWLSCSQHCADSIALYPLSHPPVVHPVHYGINVGRFSPDVCGSSLRQQIGVEDEEILVVYVARMIEEMGLGVLLQTVDCLIKETDSLKLLIVGASGHLTSRAKAKQADYPDRIFVRENVCPSAIPLVYSAADIVVAPSTSSRACLGLSIVEAMASQKAVVASKVGGTEEVIRDGYTGVLVPPNDSAALKDAIMSLASDDQLRKELGRAARQRAVSHFDEAESNRVLDSVYSSILAQ